MKIRNSPNPWDSEYKQSRQAPIYGPLWKRLQAFLKRAHGESVLDYGCGDGNYSMLIHQMGFDVTGIDVSSNAVEIAKATCRSDGLRFYAADSVPESFPENTFDIVVMLNILHCVSNNNRAELIGQIRRVLKNNGDFFASVLSVDDESYPRSRWAEVEPGTFDDGSGKLFHFFTCEEIIEEIDVLTVLDMDMLENVHPEAGRKSSLHIIAGKNRE